MKIKNKILKFLLILAITMPLTSLNAKEFVLYDAMTYPNKPDLSSDGLSPIQLIYEAKLTSPSPLNPTKAVLDFNKIDNQAEMYANFPNTIVSTDIEQWLWDTAINGDSLAVLNRTLFERFRLNFPNVIIGNYGIAPASLNIYRFNSPTLYEDILISRWKTSNLKRWGSLKYADIAFPSVYIADPNITTWISDLKLTVSEIKKYAPTKKIIVYIWPQYYDQPGSPYNREFISPEIWSQILEAVYENCDGAIIWSTKTDASENIVFWSDQRVQDMWNVTKTFIATHEIVMPEKDFVITNDNPDKTFKIFSSIKYLGTPSLVNDGLHECAVYTDIQLSNGTKDSEGIYQPDSSIIATLATRAKSVSYPIFLSGDTWIRDRNTNNTAMLSRFEKIRRIFKRINTKNALAFMQVSPPSLNYLHTAFSNSNFSLTASDWLESYVTPTRPIRDLSDYLLPASFITNDDTVTWKKEFYLTVKEARRKNLDKPVYAHFYTDYYNYTSFFPEANTPIKGETWKAMMEAAFKLCDGVVITSIGNSTWSNDLSFWIETNNFVQTHKNNIIFPNTTSVNSMSESDKNFFKINDRGITLLQNTNNFYVYNLQGKIIIHKTDVLSGENILLPHYNNDIYLLNLDGRVFKLYVRNN